MDRMDSTFLGVMTTAQPRATPIVTTVMPVRPLNVLALTLINPIHTTNGTALRVKPMLEELGRRHRITLLCADGFAAAPAPRKGRLRRLRAMADFSHPYSFQPEFQAAVNAAVASENFDVLLLSGAEMLQYIPAKSLSVVADLVDEPVLAVLRNLNAIRGWEKIVMAKHALSLLLYQRYWKNRLAAVLVVAPRDASTARRVLPGVLVREIANGVDVEYFHPGGMPRLPYEIVFSGNMSFPPNIAACLWFADHVFPRIRRALPAAHWTIVGSQPHACIQQLASRPGISVTGWVPDIRPYLEQASVCVSPLISGGGIKNKILEAWAMQKAVVSTPLGCAGIETRDGNNILIADDASTFADKTLTLLHDSQMADRLGAEARRYVETHYRWKDKAAELEILLCMIAAGGTQ